MSSSVPPVITRSLSVFDHGFPDPVPPAIPQYAAAVTDRRRHGELRTASSRRGIHERLHSSLRPICSSTRRTPAAGRTKQPQADDTMSGALSSSFIVPGAKRFRKQNLLPPTIPIVSTEEVKIPIITITGWLRPGINLWERRAPVIHVHGCTGFTPGGGDAAKIRKEISVRRQYLLLR